MTATTMLCAGLLVGTACTDPRPGPAAGAGAAGLVCEAPEVDFGEVWAGTVLRHRFELACARDGLVVEAVRADCGCTVASLEAEGASGERSPYDEAQPLAAGTRLFVDVTYDTRGKRGDAPRSVSVHTDTGRLELALRAHVRPWLETTPERIDVPLVAQGDVIERTLRVTSSDGAAFALAASGRALPPQVRVEPRPLDQQGDGEGALAATWDVDLTLGPGLPLGLHGYPIELVARPAAGVQWNAGEDGTVTVTPTVTVRVVGAVSLDPTSLSFGNVGPRETVARTVRLTSHDPELALPRPEARVVPARAEEDAALPDVARITVAPVGGADGSEERQAWDIQLLLADLGGRFEGSFLGYLVVTTGHPDQPEVRATLNGFVAPETTGAGR